MKTWAFEWKNGGYNTVQAGSKAEALKKAKAMGEPREYAPGRMTKGLEPAEQSFSTDASYLNKLEERYYQCD